MAFSFGNTGGDGKPPAATAAPGGGFSFGSPAAGAGAPAPAGGAFSFGGFAAPAPATAAAAAPNATGAGGGGFSFGSSAAAPTSDATSTNPTFGSAALGATGSAFGFGSPAAAAAGSTNAPASAAAGLSFGGFTANANTQSGDESKPAASATTATGGSGGFGFGGFGSSTASSSTNPPLSFGANNANDDSKLPATSTATTAPAFVGFGSPPPAAAPNAALANNNDAATAAGTGSKPAAVTFGGPGVAAAATTPAATAGGGASAGAFSFGSPTPAAGAATPATPQPVSTPGPPAPVTTPGGHGTPAPTTAMFGAGAASTTTPAAAPPATSNEPVRLEYQTMTVEKILNTFQQEMEKDAKVYLEEARRVAEQDAILRDAQRDLNVLTEQTRRCVIEQQEVEKTLMGIAALQDEVGRTLDTVETNVNELFTSGQMQLMPADADFEREAAYNMAHDVDLRLQSLQAALDNKLQQMDEAQERALAGYGDVAKIVQVLNQHHNSLAALEDAGRRMEQDIHQLNRVLTQYK